MNWLVIFIFMLTMHVIEDFHLQGRMADMKQKAFWAPYAEERPMYSHDYIVVLLLHGFEWSVLTSLPLLLVPGLNPDVWVALVAVNAIIHALVDHCKCNLFRINLRQDQSYHILQICGMILAVYLTVEVLA